MGIMALNLEWDLEGMGWKGLDFHGGCRNVFIARRSKIFTMFDCLGSLVAELEWRESKQLGKERELNLE